MKQSIKISKLTGVPTTALLYETGHPFLLCCCFWDFLLKKKENKSYRQEKWLYKDMFDLWFVNAIKVDPYVK